MDSQKGDDDDDDHCATIVSNSLNKMTPKTEESFIYFVHVT